MTQSLAANHQTSRHNHAARHVTRHLQRAGERRTQPPRGQPPAARCASTNRTPREETHPTGLGQEWVLEAPGASPPTLRQHAQPATPVRRWLTQDGTTSAFSQHPQRTPLLWASAVGDRFDLAERVTAHSLSRPCCLRLQVVAAAFSTRVARGHSSPIVDPPGGAEIQIGPAGADNGRSVC